MVWQLSCDCEERNEVSIDSMKIFQKLEDFFNEKVQNKIFNEEIPKQPYYIWRNGDQVRKWYATKWYRCNVCGCLWEMNYPDFPAKGFVRKFADGIYKERGF